VDHVERIEELPRRTLRRALDRTLMSWIEKLGIVVFMVLFMECFAWAAHKYVMHGWGWG